MVALEFPVFNDGRSYSAARVLRERYGFEGELRAVGDVLLEQLHFMHRSGFDAFEIKSEHPRKTGRRPRPTCRSGISRRPTGGATASQLRHR